MFVSSQFTPGVLFPATTKGACLYRAVYILAPQLGVVVVLYLVAVVATWGITDAFQIKTELKVLTIILPLLFIPFTIRMTSGILAPYVNGSYFCLPIIAISFTVTIVYPVFLSFRLKRAQSHQRSMKLGDDYEEVAGNLLVLFRLVMDREELRREFQQYCVESWCVENFLFYRDVSEYSQLGTTTERAVAGRKLVSMYIGEGAPRQVNIDMKAEAEALSGLREDGFSPDLFHLAMNQVETQMKQDTLSRWRQTGHFKTLLTRILKTEGLSIPRSTQTSLDVFIIQEP